MLGILIVITNNSFGSISFLKTTDFWNILRGSILADSFSLIVDKIYKEKSPFINEGIYVPRNPDIRDWLQVTSLFSSLIISVAKYLESGFIFLKLKQG